MALADYKIVTFNNGVLSHDTILCGSLRQAKVYAGKLYPSIEYGAVIILTLHGPARMYVRHKRDDKRTNWASGRYAGLERTSIEVARRWLQAVGRAEYRYFTRGGGCKKLIFI